MRSLLFLAFIIFCAGSVFSQHGHITQTDPMETYSYSGYFDAKSDNVTNVTSIENETNNINSATSDILLGDQPKTSTPFGGNAKVGINATFGSVKKIFSIPIGYSFENFEVGANIPIVRNLLYKKNSIAFGDISINAKHHLILNERKHLYSNINFKFPTGNETVGAGTQSNDFAINELFIMPLKTDLLKDMHAIATGYYIFTTGFKDDFDKEVKPGSILGFSAGSSFRIYERLVTNIRLKFDFRFSDEIDDVDMENYLHTIDLEFGHVYNIKGIDLSLNILFPWLSFFKTDDDPTNTIPSKDTKMTREIQLRIGSMYNF